MSYKAEDRKYLDTLRMTDRELAVIVSKELRDSDAKRRWSRRRTNFMRMAVDIAQPGGTTAKYVVRSYDLSEGGIGFFTGSYVHASTRCRLHLTTVDGELLSIDGTIAHCKNVWGHVHFAGVNFDSPIDLTWFDDTPEDAHPPPPLQTLQAQQTTQYERYAVNLAHEAGPVEQALTVIDELRQMIINEAGSDEIQACLELVRLALNLDGTSQPNQDESNPPDRSDPKDQPNQHDQSSPQDQSMPHDQANPDAQVEEVATSQN